MKIFILEDDPYRHKGFIEACVGTDLTIASSYEQAIKLWNPPYNLVLLDHDLGGHQFVQSDGIERTGYHFVEWLITGHVLDLNTPVVVHSYNPEGAAKMVDALLSLEVPANAYPYGPNLLRSIKKLITGRSTTP